jgi:hypothetical protein
MSAIYVKTAAGKHYVQAPDSNAPGGVVLLDEEQSWPGGIGLTSAWTAVDDSAVPAADRERLGWLVEELRAAAADPTLTAEQLAELPFVAETSDVGEYRVSGAAPDSSDYAGITEPGSPWADACDRILALLQSALPGGWIATWRDDDIVISWSPESAVA